MGFARAQPITALLLLQAAWIGRGFARHDRAQPDRHQLAQPLLPHRLVDRNKSGKFCQVDLAFRKACFERPLGHPYLSRRMRAKQVRGLFSNQKAGLSPGHLRFQVPQLVPGLARPTPFFDDRTKGPRSVPLLLTPSQRAAL
jgi:hypothetical protein